MKRFLSIFVIVLLLILSATTSVMAADNKFQVGLDYAFSSSIDSNLGGPNPTIACTGYTVSGEFLTDRFKLGANLAVLKPQNLDGETFSGVYGGYRIVNHVFVTLGYYYQTWTGGTTSANMVGVDALFPVTPKLSIGGNFGTSLLGTTNTGSDFTGLPDLKSTVTHYELKCVYQINDSLNVKLKYRFDDSHFTATGYSDVDNIYRWITLGAGYSF
jgi:hypothetical protein